MKEPFRRLDANPDLKSAVTEHCRLRTGEIWTDPEKGHKVGVLDAADSRQVGEIMEGKRAVCAIQDPPYNISVGSKNTSGLFKMDLAPYLSFSEKWVKNMLGIMAQNSHIYIWLGADQKAGFQPLPDFMIMMRNFENLSSRSFISLRNQRGYGTQKNWMCVRQELLYYTLGKPSFTVTYTEIPKILKGYYKIVGGKQTENIQRSRSDTIRPGNIWLDVQQVFYRMEENVPGAYAQKPVGAIERIIKTSSEPGDLIVDFFAHSGTTLIASEKLGRTCCTFDNDPIFAELTIRRLERFRKTGKIGWQCEDPFPEIPKKDYV